MSARTDKATPCSLTHHGYFDLDGQGDIRGYHLRIVAEDYLPVDAQFIPDGRILHLAGTPLDFRADRLGGEARGLDHNFCPSHGPAPPDRRERHLVRASMAPRPEGRAGAHLGHFVRCPRSRLGTRENRHRRPARTENLSIRVALSACRTKASLLLGLDLTARPDRSATG
ncbi:hypothetical protein [Paracoccus bogoriensis]|uniref:aldose epimerase family protein n=1 Tax=Paracoccus bogoriensis TaxID=242065 RepID=UPI002484AFF1|nr:hypothetical protein [Paracoccus bogoriensis]